MKKILVIILAVMLTAFCASAFAEAVDEKPFIDFDIKMDNIPEGYSFETSENGGHLLAVFLPDDPEKMFVYVSVAYSDAFASYTLNSSLSDEEFEAAEKMLTADYNSPAVEIRETEYGTALLVITENDSQSDYADLITIWHGYFVHVGLQKATDLTEEDFDLAVKIASDMWFIEM